MMSVVMEPVVTTGVSSVLYSAAMFSISHSGLQCLIIHVAASFYLYYMEKSLEICLPTHHHRECGLAGTIAAV